MEAHEDREVMMKTGRGRGLGRWARMAEWERVGKSWRLGAHPLHRARPDMGRSAGGIR